MEPMREGRAWGAFAASLPRGLVLLPKGLLLPKGGVFLSDLSRGIFVSLLRKRRSGC